MFWLGSPPFAWWIMKYATAISPLARNAAGLVNRPIMISEPQTVSMISGPADHRKDRHLTLVPPSEPEHPLQPVQPRIRNMNPNTIRIRA